MDGESGTKPSIYIYAKVEYPLQSKWRLLDLGTQVELRKSKGNFYFSFDVAF